MVGVFELIVGLPGRPLSGEFLIDRLRSGRVCNHSCVNCVVTGFSPVACCRPLVGGMAGKALGVDWHVQGSVGQ